MSALTARELRLIYDHLPQLYSVTEVQTLAERAMDMVHTLFTADAVGLSFSDPRLPYIVAGWSPHIPCVEKYIDTFQQLAPQHPFFGKWKTLGTREKAIRFSDCLTQEEWERLPINNEFFRPLRLKHLVGAWKEFGGGHHVELGIVRESRDFSNRECIKLEYVAQHVGQAYLNCKLISELKRDAPLPAQWLTSSSGLKPLRLNSPQDGYAPGELDALKTAPTLTDRERQVLDWVVEGKTNPEIAIILDISARTVQKHLERVFQKLAVETRTAAAMRAIEMGLAKGEVPA
jgi:DNA-binding CsgD family transcriptional regulator